MQLRPHVMHNRMSSLAIETWFESFDEWHHLLSEESVCWHELDLARWFQLVVLHGARILGFLKSSTCWVLVIFTFTSLGIVCVVYHEGVLDLMDGLFQLVDSGVSFLDALMIVSLDLFDLIFVLQPFLFAQLIVPLWFDECMQLLGGLMRKLIFEWVEVLVCEQLQRSLRWPLTLMKWNESWLHLISACIISILQVLNFLLVHLNLCLLLISQVAHVLRIIVDDKPVVWRHVSWKRNLQSRRIRTF